MKMKITLALIFGTILLCTSCIGVRLTGTGGGILEDAVLFGSAGGAAPRAVFKFGDIELTDATYPFNFTVDEAITHWWLIGHMGSNVVYSSTMNMTGDNLYAFEPYDIPGAELAWNIPANLDGFVNGTGYSFDWYVQTIMNHSSHVSPDQSSASLWRFSPNGSHLCDAYIDLHAGGKSGNSGTLEISVD